MEGGSDDRMNAQQISELCHAAAVKDSAGKNPSVKGVVQNTCPVPGSCSRSLLCAGLVQYMNELAAHYKPIRMNKPI